MIRSQQPARASKKLGTLVTLLAMISVIAAGCGGDDEDSASSDEAPAAESAAPEATESIDEFAARFAEAGAASAAQDCDVVKDFNRFAGFTMPCEPGFDGYADVEVTGSEEFGPAGIVDYTSKESPEGATALAGIAAEDGRFQLIGSYLPSSIDLSVEQVGTEPEDQELRDAAAADFVESTREEDCDTYFDVTITPTQNVEKECRLQFDPKAEIQPQLAAAPEAEPESLGGTEAYGFHELDTGENYRILVTVRDFSVAAGEEPGEDRYLVISYRSR